ncbi:anti-sigma factor [Planotetraspora sp. A-T 1434]|uniref:anti-sigma factor n=1 Tax=Planotetraspora sp. A-T 1434 TaxID=2979219 RepID=UPI0021C085EA|nr:anti-sigma factor [Planotetraspora sp. A-T 1434]MCT9934620.1 anti-sigma factor [Planotetraspora sp. A-T 1434]
MTDETRSRDPHTLAGAYALDAIDHDTDRLRFEHHLARCAECAQELRGLVETAARLGQAAAVEPPAALRERVMAEIGQVRQLPPLLLPGSSGPGPSPFTRWWPRLAAGLAAACLIAAVALGAVLIQTRDQLEQARAGNRQIAAVLAAPDARTVTGSGVDGHGATGTVVVSRSQGRLVFASSGLAALPDGKTYQLWEITSGRMRSAGLLRPDASGAIPPVVAAGAGRADQVGLTVEPAGGSAQPTTRPLLLLDLRTA